MGKNVQIDKVETGEVAAYLCGLSDEAEYDEIDNALAEKYGVDVETFGKILADIYERMDIGISPLTNTPMLGLSNKERNQWLAKKEITGQYIGTVIQWMSDGEDILAGGGFERDIVSDGVVEFTVTIKKPKLPE